jgi:hypothetical protein
MSRRNGQRARFQINRKRRILKRVRTQALVNKTAIRETATDVKTPE